MLRPCLDAQVDSDEPAVRSTGSIGAGRRAGITLIALATAFKTSGHALTASPSSLGSVPSMGGTGETCSGVCQGAQGR